MLAMKPHVAFISDNCSPALRAELFNFPRQFSRNFSNELSDIKCLTLNFLTEVINYFVLFAFPKLMSKTTFLNFLTTSA